MAQPLDPNRLAGLLYLKVKEAGLTLREVSRRIGKGDDYLSRLLNRRRKLDVGTLYDVLEVLDLPPAQFFAELKRAAPAEAALSARDPDEMLLGTITRGELFSAIRRVVQEELERGHDRPSEAGPSFDEEPGGGPGEDGDEGS